MAKLIEKTNTIPECQEAQAQGKRIQYRTCEGKWVDLPEPRYNAQRKYRIKPQFKVFP